MYCRKNKVRQIFGDQMKVHFQFLSTVILQTERMPERKFGSPPIRLGNVINSLWFARLTLES